MDKKLKIKELESKLKIKNEEVNLLNLESHSIRCELLELEWPIMQWYELEKWLKENRPENDYTKNPMIKHIFPNQVPETYCKLNKNGKLQIGAYEYNDYFKEGSPVRVSHDFKSWR